MRDFLKITGAGIIFFFLWSCGGDASKKSSLAYFIPENPMIVWKIKNFEALKSDIKNNSLLEAFEGQSPYSFFSENKFLQHIKPAGESLFCLNKINDSTTAYTFITRQNPGLFVTDSLQNRTVETLSYNRHTLQRITLDGHTVYTTLQDSVFIASSSQLLLQNILEHTATEDPEFQKLYDLKQNGELIALFPTKRSILNDTTINFASWMALDTHVLPNAIEGSGVAMAYDTLPQLLSVFKGLLPRQNDMAKVIPADARGALAFTFNDAALFEENLKQYHGKAQIPSTELFGSVNEVGRIQTASGIAVALKSIDPTLTEESLLPFISEKNTFREVAIQNFNDSYLLGNHFSPFIEHIPLPLVFRLDTFFVFTENETVAEEMISAFKNNAVLAGTAGFKEASAQLSSASSLIFYGMNSGAVNMVAGFLNTELLSEIQGIRLDNYRLATLQYTYDRNFAHVNLICREASNGKQVSGAVSETFSIELAHPILGEPQFFSNHRTHGKDIAVQDISNKLYLISSGGKTLWSRQLDHPILGAIEEVDLLRNGKKQLAFVTKNTFYILDRNGKDVGPFPLKFKDAITQPLAVFDYDNNRKYRFVVTQGDELFMYDSEGKAVKGFTFRKAGSDIVQPPKHIRIGNKDYILIPEEKGILHIVSRVGKSRVSVSKKFEFSDIPLTREGSDFIVITADKTKVSISPAGKVVSQQLEVSNDYWFTTRGNTKATLDDNLLRINGKLAELPFGIYTHPEVFTFNKKTYISLTETQEGKVYVFDTTGSIIPGFPVYGTTTAQLADATGKGDLNILVRGSEREILLYKFQ